MSLLSPEAPVVSNHPCLGDTNDFLRLARHRHDPVRLWQDCSKDSASVRIAPEERRHDSGASDHEPDAECGPIRMGLTANPKSMTFPVAWSYLVV